MIRTMARTLTYRSSIMGFALYRLQRARLVHSVVRRGRIPLKNDSATALLRRLRPPPRPPPKLYATKGSIGRKVNRAFVLNPRTKSMRPCTNTSLVCVLLYRRSVLPAGAEVCSDCPAGHFSDSTAHSDLIDVACKNCPCGQVSWVGSPTCNSSCPDGLYSADGARCLNCPAGSACLDGIRTACTSGTYQEGEGGTSCIQCPSGHFGDASFGVASKDHCRECELGQYQNEIGKTFCHVVKAGYSLSWSDSSGVLVQLQCPSSGLSAPAME
jgi:hypothetical protein